MNPDFIPPADPVGDLIFGVAAVFAVAAAGLALDLAGLALAACARRLFRAEPRTKGPTC